MSRKSVTAGTAELRASQAIRPLKHGRCPEPIRDGQGTWSSGTRVEDVAMVGAAARTSEGAAITSRGW